MYFIFGSWGQVVASDVAWAQGGQGWGPRRQEGQRRARESRLVALGSFSSVPLSPHLLRLLLWGVGPEVEKLDLSPSGQWLSPRSRGTQLLEEPQSQELGTASHPSSPSHRRQWERALLGSGGWSWGGPSRSLAVLTQGGLPHLPPQRLSCSAPGSQA